jgi:hypothetical protein
VTPPPTPAPAASLCPACRRFIGPALRCPYCDQAAPSRLPARLLYWAAACLALGGLAALYLTARLQTPHAVTIGALTPAMNYARISIEGTVPRTARVARSARPDGPAATYLAFPVDDGTGELTVVAYRQAARAIDDLGATPRRGERVRVTGTLNVADGDTLRLVLTAPDHLLQIAPAPAKPHRQTVSRFSLEGRPPCRPQPR